jgi:hypothetical protein
MPNPLPCAMMNEHVEPSDANSEALGVADVNGVSVTAYVPAVADELACRVVPHAAMPGASVAVATDAAEPLQLPPTGTVATSLMTTDVGVPRVRGFTMRSR